MANTTADKAAKLMSISHKHRPATSGNKSVNATRASQGSQIAGSGEAARRATHHGPTNQ